MKYISYTALSIYQQCPLKYKFTYIENLSNSYCKEKSHLSFGESIHRTLSDFFKIDVRKRDLKKFEELLDKNWISKGYSTSEEEFEYRQLGLYIIENFYKNNDISIRPILIDEFFRVKINDFFIAGKIDRVDSSSHPSEVEIIDYKTGKFIPLEEEIKNDTQLFIYTHALKQLRNLNVKKINVHFLRYNQLFSFTPTDNDIKTSLIKVEDIYRKIKSDKEFLPRKNIFCSNCDYMMICPLMSNIPKTGYSEITTRFKEIKDDIYFLNKAYTEIYSLLNKKELINKIIELLGHIFNTENCLFIETKKDISGKICFTYHYGNKKIPEQHSLINTAELEILDCIQNQKLELFQLHYFDVAVNQQNEISKQSVLIIPLSISENLSEIIILFLKDRILRKFNDLSLFKCLLMQISISLKNACLYETSITDSLTGLFIKRYFLQRLQYEMEWTKKNRKQLCLVLIDIDNFKKINDTYGHIAGDKVLEEAAKLLNTIIGEKGISVRYGGEEFAVILSCTDISDAHRIIESYRSLIENKIFLISSEKSINITVSAGINVWDYKTDIESFIDKTDKLLYQAKNSGRNCICSISSAQHYI